MKHSIFSIALIVLVICWPSQILGVTTNYDLVLPYLSDKTVKTAVKHHLVDSSVLIKPDNITDWIAIASDLHKIEAVRVYAIKRLWDYRQKRIERCLIPLLKDSSMKVRQESARNLGKMKFPSSAKPLIDGLRFSYGNTSMEMQKSLKSITGQEFGTSYNVWMKWYDRNYREYR
jgi:hypothetical protein